MVNQLETMLLHDLFTQAVDLRIVKFNDLARFRADHVIMLLAAIQFKYGMTRVKIMPHHKARRLKLGQHPIDRGQADFLAVAQQCLVNVFRAEMPIFGVLKDLQDTNPRQGGLQTGFL